MAPPGNPHMQAWTVIDPSSLGMYMNVGLGVHITGFTDPMAAIANAMPEATKRLRDKKFLTWGGDHFNQQSFTALIPEFLKMAPPNSKVLAFRNRAQGNYDAHAEFKQSWQFLADQYRGSFCIVEIDAQADAARYNVIQETQPGGQAGTLGGAVRYFLLGRLAVKICGTKSIVALGGGGIAGCEMKCGVAYDNAQWSVFGLSRGRQEANNTLLDEAARLPNVELVRGVDPSEAQAFAMGIPPMPFPAPPWAQSFAAPASGIVGHGFFPPGSANPAQQPAAAAGQPAQPAPTPMGGWPPAAQPPASYQSPPQLQQQYQPQPAQPQQPLPMQLADGACKCKRWSCSKPSWNKMPNGFCTMSCRDNPEQWNVPAQQPPPVPQPVPQQVPTPLMGDPLPINGVGFEDIQSTGHMPLANFIKDFTPEKSCEAYLREEVSSVPMMHSVARFMEDIIRECKQCSQQKMYNGIAQQFPGLNNNMVFAAIVFTFELQIVNLQARDENEFYRQYNNSLRQRNSQAIRGLAGYSHFLFSAVSMMPAHVGVLWRGIRGEDAVRLAMERYCDGMEINWSAWSSASLSRDIAKISFATQQGATRGLLIRIEARQCARDISQLSVMPREQERVIFPNTKFIVTTPYHTVADGIGEIHLKELGGAFVF